MKTYDTFKAKGRSRSGEYYESESQDSPGKARAIARRKGGTYEILSRINPERGGQTAGMWSGGECGKFD